MHHLQAWIVLMRYYKDLDIQQRGFQILIEAILSTRTLLVSLNIHYEGTPL